MEKKLTIFAVIFLGLLLCLASACKRPADTGPSVEQPDNSPEDNAEQDNSSEDTLKDSLAAKNTVDKTAAQVEKLKKHQNDLKNSGITHEGIIDIFEKWKKKAGAGFNDGPLHEGFLNTKKERKKALDYLLKDDSNFRDSINAFVNKDEISDESQAKTLVHDILNEVSYENLEQAAATFIEIANNNYNFYFYGETGYGVNKQHQHNHQPYRHFQKPFIAYMEALQKFAKDKLFSD